MRWPVTRDGRDDRIAELEAKLVEKDGQLAAEIAARAALEQQVAALMKQVAELTEKLGRNSGNSSSPPPLDSPAERR